MNTIKFATVQQSKIVGGIQKNGKETTISIPLTMYNEMLKFANGNEAAVSDACRYAARKVKDTDDNFSKAVREKALAVLRGGYIPDKLVKQQLVQMYLENEEAVRQILARKGVK